VKLYELSTAIVGLISIVAMVYIVFWERNDDDSCPAAIIFSKNVAVDCKPELKKDIVIDRVEDIYTGEEEM